MRQAERQFAGLSSHDPPRSSLILSDSLFFSPSV
jgi:hypothetical protein